MHRDEMKAVKLIFFWNICTEIQPEFSYKKRRGPLYRWYHCMSENSQVEEWYHQWPYVNPTWIVVYVWIPADFSTMTVVSILAEKSFNNLPNTSDTLGFQFNGEGCVGPTNFSRISFSQGVHIYSQIALFDKMGKIVTWNDSLFPHTSSDGFENTPKIMENIHIIQNISSARESCYTRESLYPCCVFEKYIQPRYFASA